MRKRRLIWLAVGLLAAVLYLFDNNAGTLTLLVGVLVLPAFGALTLAGRGVDLELEVRPVGEKRQKTEGVVKVRSGSLLPRARVALTLRCRNLRTGQERETPVELGVPPKGRGEVPFALVCEHCGRMEITAEEVRVLDPFGLFSRRLNRRARQGFTVPPELFPCTVALAELDRIPYEDETEAAHRPGNDPGEWIALREYVPGDAIRRIHWKLSEKTGQTMVREFGQPTVRETALLLDRRAPDTAGEADAVTEVFASLSAGLLEAGIRHSVFWLNGAPGQLTEYRIEDEETFMGMLQALLELAPMEGSMAEAFAGRPSYAHVILVAGKVPEYAGMLLHENRVSVVVPRRETTAEGLQPDGTYVVGFEEGSRAADLCRVEV